MKINIAFIDKKNDEFIFNIDDAIDCFNVGDKLYLSVSDIYPKTIEYYKEKYNDALINTIVENNDDLIKKHNNVRYKIISKHMSLDKNINHDDHYSVKIEYYLKKSPKFYFKWWYIKYSIINFLKIKFK